MLTTPIKIVVNLNDVIINEGPRRLPVDTLSL